MGVAKHVWLRLGLFVFRARYRLAAPYVTETPVGVEIVILRGMS